MSAPWPEVPLTAVADLVRGVSYPKTDSRDDPAAGYVPVLRATNIQDARLVLETDLVYVAESNVSPEQRLRPGDIVVATSSGSKHLVGKSALLHGQWHGSFGAFCAGIRPKPNIESRYLAYFLQSPRYWKEIGKKALGVNINNLRRGDLETLSLPLPPAESQRQIVAGIEKQFSRLDKAVANLQRVKASLKHYKAAVLKDAVDGRLVETEAEIAGSKGRKYESGEQLLRRVVEARRLEGKTRSRAKEAIEPELTELPELPDGWAWASIDQLAAAEAGAITDGPFGSNLKSEHYVSTGPRVIRLQNIKDGEFADEYAHISAEHFSKLRKHEVFAGDLVIASLGENPPRACVIPPSVGLAIVKADCIRFKPHPSVSAAYLNVALNCPPTRARVKDVLHGIGRPRLSLGEIRAIALPLPPEAEQHRIVAEVDRRSSIVREVEAEVDANLKRAQALRQAVLSRAFRTTGIEED